MRDSLFYMWKAAKHMVWMELFEWSQENVLEKGQGFDHGGKVVSAMIWDTSSNFCEDDPGFESNQTPSRICEITGSDVWQVAHDIQLALFSL